MWQGKQDFQRSRAALSNLSVEQNPRQASERKGREKNTCNKLQNKTLIPRSWREGRERGWGLSGGCSCWGGTAEWGLGAVQGHPQLRRPSWDGGGSLKQGSYAIPHALSSPCCPSPQTPGLRKSPVFPLTSGRIHSSPRQTLGLLVLFLLECNCSAPLCSSLLYNE